MIRVGIVNDLRLAVEVLKRAVAAMPDARVAWIAEDGAQAVDMCARDVPDIVLMDMIMPVMDGVEATRRIMRATPCPILVVTATVEGNATRVFDALGAGALDAVATPTLGADGGLINAEPLVRKMLAIAMLAGGAAPRQIDMPAPGRPLRASSSLVAIGSSTGGPQALATLLKALPRPTPWPVIVVQHIDPEFAQGLAQWLTSHTGHAAATARAGASPSPGSITIAATLDHLVIGPDGSFRYVVQPMDQPYRPSVDVFFDSLLASRQPPGVAVLLTGMGRDGAAGLARLRTAGWHTIAQDQHTSVVWGMPGAAVELGAAVETLPIDHIGLSIVRHMPADRSPVSAPSFGQGRP